MQKLPLQNSKQKIIILIKRMDIYVYVCVCVSVWKIYPKPLTVSMWE